MTDYAFDFGGFHLSQPLWLLLLVPVGLAGWYVARRRRQPAVLYSSVELLRQLPRSWALRTKRLLPWIRTAGLALIVMALARPQWGQDEFRVKTEGIAIQMCLDCSGSMREKDFTLDGRRVTRLEAVKQVFDDFVSGTDEDEDDLAGRPDDQIGLIAFGGYVMDKCPLTLDHGALLNVLKTVQIPPPIQDEQGKLHPLLEGLTREQLGRLAQQGVLARLEERQQTAVGDALARAVDQLEDADAKSKVIILLSDGRQTAGVVRPADAAEAARTEGIKVYTIGVGRRTSDVTTTTDFFAMPVLRRAPGYDLDEETLKLIADRTGGEYFHAENTEALTEVYAAIDASEKTETEGQRFTRYHEHYRWWLFPGLSLLLLETVLVSTRFRSLP